MTEKGQITIPVDLRRQLGLQPGDEIEVALDGDALTVRRSPSATGRGRRIVEHLRGRARGTSLSTDEIMQLTRGE